MHFSLCLQSFRLLHYPFFVFGKQTASNIEQLSSIHKYLDNHVAVFMGGDFAVSLASRVALEESTRHDTEGTSYHKTNHPVVSRQWGGGGQGGSTGRSRISGTRSRARLRVGADGLDGRTRRGRSRHGRHPIRAILKVVKKKNRERNKQVS